MTLAEKLKVVDPTGKSDGERGRGEVNERVIVTDVSNVKVGERMAKAPSNTPVIVISSDIKTLRNGNGNRGRMVRFVRHTLGRRDSCQW